MNVISQLPRWAQAPTQSFISQARLPGTETTLMTADTFEDSFKVAAGVVELSSNDEIPGEDQAMGQPGVVRRNGVTVHFEGDSSLSKGQVEAIVTGTRRGVEYATYVHARPDGFTTLQMVNEDGTVDLHGSMATQKGGVVEGFLIAGQFNL